MNAHTWLEHAALAMGLALIAGVALERSRIPAALPALLLLLSAGCAVALIALIVNHVQFPFQIDLMEGVVMQHARRAMHGQSIYPAPSPQFVPLAYNALYYLLAAPFFLMFGDTLSTLRVVSGIGLVGSATAIFVIVRSTTRSAWWGVVAVGLFCAAYPAMDAYLDTAHSDAWLLCCALWGSYLIGRESRGERIAGVLALVAAFWFKQHGAVFLGAALVYLTWREGIRGSLVYWSLAIVLGPVLYLIAPGSVLGADFHYFTWRVPGGWSQLTVNTIDRVIVFVRHNYPILGLAALIGAYRALRARTISIFDVQLGAAFLTALMGSLDPDLRTTFSFRWARSASFADQLSSRDSTSAPSRGWGCASRSWARCLPSPHCCVIHGRSGCRHRDAHHTPIC